MKKVIKVPIFKSQLTVFQSETLEDCVKQSGITLNCSIENFNALTVYIRWGTIYLMFNEKSCTPGIIAHEAKHAVNYILSDIGQKLDNDNDEMECYLLNWVVDELHKYLKLKQ